MSKSDSLNVEVYGAKYQDVRCSYCGRVASMTAISADGICLCGERFTSARKIDAEGEKGKVLASMFATEPS